MTPQGWQIVPLERAGVQVIDGDRGKSYPSAGDLLPDGHCLFLTAKNVTRRGFVFEDTQFITELKHSELNKGTLKRGDTVLTTRGTVGNIAHFSNDIPFENIRINSGQKFQS